MSGGGDPSDISRKQRALQAETAERLEAIVEAAERAAQGVIDDAEAQARRYLAQARAEADRVAGSRVAGLSDLIDSLLSQARSLREEAERLQATLEEAKTWVEEGQRSQQGEREQAEEQLPPRLRAVGAEEAPPAPASAPAPEAEGKRTDAAGARLLATQMAVEGSSREEIEQRLRSRFEVEDTDAILDAILGPED
jgi:polyhydroxyalkanoate synthesis regulator phasin